MVTGTRTRLRVCRPGPVGHGAALGSGARATESSTPSPPAL